MTCFASVSCQFLVFMVAFSPPAPPALPSFLFFSPPFFLFPAFFAHEKTPPNILLTRSSRGVPVEAAAPTRTMMPVIKVNRGEEERWMGKTRCKGFREAGKFEGVHRVQQVGQGGLIVGGTVIDRGSTELRWMGVKYFAAVDS